MADFKIHTIASAPLDAKVILEAARDKYGFLPNLLGEMAAAPPVLKGYVTLNELLATTSLSPIEQQIVLLTTSLANGCTYCVAAHTAGLKVGGYPPDQIEALRNSVTLADGRLEALRIFTLALVDGRGKVEPHAVQSFAAAGYTREQLLEVLLGVAMKTLSNYVNHFANTPLDPQLQAFAWEPAHVSG